MVLNALMLLGMCMYRHVKFHEAMFSFADKRGHFVQSLAIKNTTTSTPFFFPFNSTVCTQNDGVIFPSNIPLHPSYIHLSSYLSLHSAYSPDLLAHSVDSPGQSLDSSSSDVGPDSNLVVSTIPMPENDVRYVP